MVPQREIVGVRYPISDLQFHFVRLPPRAFQTPQMAVKTLQIDLNISYKILDPWDSPSEGQES